MTAWSCYRETGRDCMEFFTGRQVVTVWSRYIKLILNPLQGDGEMAGAGRDCMELLPGDRS